MKSDTITFISQSGNDSVNVQLKRQFPWWIFLLLPLLLLLPMEREFQMKFVEGELNTPVALTPTDIKYQNIKTFGSHADSAFVSTTNEQGLSDTITVHEPLWHWLFAGSGDSVYVSIDNECTNLDSAFCYNDFPKDEPLIAKLATKYKDVVLKIVDQENHEPLPDTDVDVEIIHQDGKSDKTKLKSDVAGQIEIHHCAVCDQIHYKASKQYYKDTEDTIAASSSIIGDEIELVPLKESIRVFVKDKRTRQPIPGASVTLEIIGGQSAGQLVELTSNINGVILAQFDNLRLTWKIKLTGHKDGYRDGFIDEYTVDKFAKLDQESRTIYLDPIEQTLTFINTDGANRLPGVKNVITVDGQVRQNPEYSNSNGEFTVANVYGNSVISIVASKPGYSTNSTKVKNKKFSDLNTQDSRTIPLTEEDRSVKISVAYPCSACNWSTAITDPCNTTFTSANFSSSNCGGCRPVSFTDVKDKRSDCVWKKAAPGDYIVTVSYIVDNGHDNTIPFTITDKNGTRTIDVFSKEGTHVAGSTVTCKLRVTQ